MLLWLALAVFVVAFLIARLIGSRLYGDVRRFVLYVLAFGGPFAIIAVNKAMSDAVLIVSFFTLFVMFFAVLTAPERA